MKLLILFFWISLFIVFYTYLGYGSVLYLLVRIKEQFRPRRALSLPEDASLPEVPLFITAFNEESVINEKMKNCLALDYPSDKLHILWVTDGSNDRTNELLKNWPQATVCFQPERQGKTAAMNRGSGSLLPP
ncbi:MAG: glycosyltransferase [Bacteroides sp.]|nr:glycosyltransferase [Bacteroides sp.]